MLFRSRAVQRLEAIIQIAPDFYGAHARLGLIFQQEGCFGDAEAEYIKASELSPRSVQPLINLASAQIRSADLPGQREASINRALASLSKVLDLRPTSAIAHCLTGAAKYKLEAYEEARASYEHALDIDGGLGVARLMLANLLLHQEKWSDAIEHLKMYLNDNPWAPNASIVREMLAGAEKKLSPPHRG